jgi:DNA invertase Pin-like site-specific DNA recombinase
MQQQNTHPRKGRVLGYFRVSPVGPDIDTQELAIRRYCATRGLALSNAIKVTMSSRKNSRQRRIDELIETLGSGDTLVVSELSRLARSVGQIAVMVNSLLQKKVRLIAIKERIDLNDKPDMKSEVMITMFSLFAELERGLISERTKEGLFRAKGQGKQLGRPKGSLGKSKLDGKEQEIENLLRIGVTKANIARIVGCSWSALNSFIKTRRL